MQGSSQDEVILLEFAAQSGIVSLVNRTQSSFFIKEDNSEQISEYRMIKHIEFDSDRKMMTVIVADENGEFYAFSKGADTAILPRIQDQKSDIYDKTNHHMEKLAEEGMRTLVFAYKKLGRLGADFAEQPDEFFESDLQLLGATGVEDML